MFLNTVDRSQLSVFQSTRREKRLGMRSTTWWGRGGLRGQQINSEAPICKRADQIDFVSARRICSSAPLFKYAVEDLKKLLLNNRYPQGIISFNINAVLNRNKNKANIS